MVFYIPMKHECPVCDYKCDFSRSLNHTAPVSQSGTPYCPKCFDAFLAEHVPKMTNTKQRSENY